MLIDVRWAELEALVLPRLVLIPHHSSSLIRASLSACEPQCALYPLIDCPTLMPPYPLFWLSHFHLRRMAPKSQITADASIKPQPLGHRPTGPVIAGRLSALQSPRLPRRSASSEPHSRQATAVCAL